MENKGKLQGCRHCNCCGWRKGTSQDEATLNFAKIKPAALTVIEVRLSEGISKSQSE